MGRFPRVVMMRTAFILLWALGPMLVHGQLLTPTELDTVREYRGLAAALKDPDQVYRLDLSRSKLKEVPEEVRRFKNLQALDLGKNKLKALPGWMRELQYMQELRAGNNKFTEIPAAVCTWKHLRRLDMHQNAITGIPACMGALPELFSLDLWSNDLEDFPDELSDLKTLRFMDLRAIQFSQSEIDRVTALLPHVKIFFSQPCNCGH